MIKQLIAAKNVVTPVPIPTPVPTPKPTPVSPGYDASQDSNCLRASGVQCIRCAYRYYLLNSQCKMVPDECK